MKTFVCDGCGATLPEESDGHPTLRVDALDMAITVQLHCVCPRSGKELDLCIFCTRNLIDQIHRPPIERMTVVSDGMPPDVLAAKSALDRFCSRAGRA